MPKILYVEDDKTLAFLTQDHLESKGFSVIHCEDGLQAFEAFQNQDFDLCILDIMLPKLDGFQLAEKIRSVNTHIPILFLSAKTLKEDRIHGLKLGADDYLVKPFSIEELVLKMEVFLKRSVKVENNSNSSTLLIGKYELDASNFLLKFQDERINLTQREADVLSFMAQRKNQILKREEILKAIWGEDDYFMGRSLDVFISRLRKILSVEPRVQIENIHGVGFRFSETN